MTQYSDNEINWIRDELVKPSLKARITVNKLAKSNRNRYVDRFSIKRTVPALASIAYQVARKEGIAIHLSRTNITPSELAPRAFEHVYRIQDVKELPKRDNSTLRAQLESQLKHQKNVVTAIELLLESL